MGGRKFVRHGEERFLRSDLGGFLRIFLLFDQRDGQKLKFALFGSSFDAREEAFLDWLHPGLQLLRPRLDGEAVSRVETQKIDGLGRFHAVRFLE